MAKRKHKQYRTIPSDEIQGDGSWVKIRNLSMPEVIKLAGTEKIDPNNVDPEQAAAAGFEVLKAMVVDWDWVDDNDKPLPKPPDDPDIIDRLPFQESAFLMEATGIGEMFDTKNSRSR